MKKILFLLLLFIPLAHAQEAVNDYNDYSSLEMKVSLDSQFEMLRLGNEAKVDFVLANLSFFPQKDLNLEVEHLEKKSEPAAEITQNQESLSFRWDHPEKNNFYFGFDSNVKVTNALFIVDKKVNFPLDPIENEYTKATAFIDINPDIRAKAAELASGEDDTYAVAFKIGDWVEKNVKYDLNTLTADVVKPSSWVFVNREGVCDELTNLFISMMRSLGIPARFVSGIAYTNVGHQWGPHGWAEVYFPEKGWIPFDVTYGQLGWLDPSHIKLKVAADSGDSSVKYLWRAYGVKFKAQKVNITAASLSLGTKIGRQVDFRIHPLINNVAPGSYVPLEVTITNKQDHYLPEIFVITKAPELTEKNVKRILLKPGETKTLHWTAIIPNSVDPGFSYYTFVEVEDEFHSKARANVSYSVSGKAYSSVEAENLIKAGSEITGSKNLELKCQAPDYVFSYESVDLQCTIKNLAGRELKNVQVCVASECRYLNLIPDETQIVKFPLHELKTGLNKIDIAAEAPEISIKNSVLVNVLASPDLIVNDINAPDLVGYDTNFNITFILSVKAPVQDVRININNHEVTDIPKMENSKRVIVSTNGREYVRLPDANITINFKDRNEKQYHFTKILPIKVENVPFIIRVLLWLRVV